MPVESEPCAYGVLNAESGKPVELAMQQLWLQGKILPVGARLMVRHVFRSAATSPLEVIYSFGLPRDAALRRFVITGDGFRVKSHLKPTEEAVKEYESGIQDGHLATLARQYRDGVVNLTVGNIRPKETVVVLLEILAGIEARDTGLRFRFPFTLAPGYHREARMVQLDPGVGETELPEQEFDDVILPRYQQHAADMHEVGFVLSVAMAQPVAEISSPSHAVRVKTGDAHSSRVMLAPARDLPDRDLVLDVTTRDSKPSVLAGAGKDGKRRFAALVPSKAFGEESNAPRRVIFVLDRSGSMQGPPIDQAKKALEACLGSLAADDLFGIVAFDNAVETLSSEMREGDLRNRDEASKFLSTIQARGGTELAQAVAEAGKMLGHTAGDILIITDGQVMGTEQILGDVQSRGMRLHCLGIGSASQDRFLTLLARETGGVCRFLTPRERVDLGAVDLFASIGRPVVSELTARVEGPVEGTIEGSEVGTTPVGQVAPEPPAAVFAGTPVIVFGRAEPSGSGKLVLAWKKPEPKKLELALDVADSGVGETLRLLQGSRLITDLDSKYIGERPDRALDRREQKRIGDQIQALSEAYGLASRRMSLVAVVERTGDQAGQLPQTTVVPVGSPQDVAFGAYFRKMAGPAVPSGFQMMAPPMPPAAPSPMSPTPSLGSSRPTPPSAAAGSRGMFTRMSDAVQGLIRPKPLERKAPPGQPAKPEEPQAVAVPTPEDLLIDLARQLEPDGGMPGKNDLERVQKSLAAVLAFLIEGHTPTSGAFRAHVQRLMRFLETSPFAGLNPQQRETLRQVLERTKTGAAPPWKVAELLGWKPAEAWDRIAKR